MADLNKSILDTLRKIWEKLCTITDLLQNPATTTSIDPEVVCLSNDGGATVVTGWEVFDTATNPPTSTLYIGGVAVTGYSVVPCSITPGLSNYPITNIINSNSTFSTTIDYYSLSYSVIGSNGSLTTPHNGITRILFDGESGEFKGDDQKTLDNILTFTTGASTTIIINAIVKL